MPDSLDTPPDAGDILSRIDSLETRFTVAIEKVAKGLEAQGKEKKALDGFLFGGTDGPGFVELVRQHDRWIATQRKILLALVPAVFLGVGAVLWQTVVLALRTANGG